MNIIERAKNILITPAKEWDVIAGEEPNVNKILTSYVLPLAGAAALAAFIGYGLIGFSMLGYKMSGVDWGLYQALVSFIVSICSVFITAWVVDALAPSFSSEKSFGRSFQLVAYAFTASWVGGLFQVLPAIAILGTILGLYGLYILYLGMPKLKNTPADKHLGYFVVTLIVLVAVYLVIGIILSMILEPMFGLNRGADNFRMDNY
jgi:hypothetical protein